MASPEGWTGHNKNTIFVLFYQDGKMKRLGLNSHGIQVANKYKEHRPYAKIFLITIIAYFCTRLSRKTEGMDPAKSWQPAGKMSGATFHHAICVGR
jgi:dihydroorotate dehydrogenase